MATHANSTPAHANATALMAAAVKGAASDMKIIRALADTIVDRMQAIHGGTWVVRVDHDTKFLSIRQSADDAAAQPKRGEVI